MVSEKIPRRPVRFRGTLKLARRKMGGRYQARRAGIVHILIGFAGVQLLVQILTGVVGFVIVRTLSRSDYGIYSLCAAVLTGCGVIAHSGFASVILSRGAQVRDDRRRLSDLMTSAFAYRTKVTMRLSVVAAAVQTLLLSRFNVDPLQNSLLALSTAVTLLLSARVAVSNELFLLEFHRKWVQGVGLLGASVRLISQSLLGVLQASTALSTILIQLASVIAARRVQGRLFARHLDIPEGVESEHDAARIRRSFLELLPGNALFVFQGQVVLFLLATLGHGGVVADLGAVTRYTMLFGVVGGTVSGVLAPMLARKSPDEVLRFYALTCVGVTAWGGLATAAVFAFSRPMTFLLGQQYASLETTLRISFAAAALWAVAEVMSSLNQARGWVRGAWVQLPGLLITVAVVINCVDVSVATGAAWMSASLVAPGLVTQGLQLLLGWRSSGIDVVRTTTIEEIRT